MTTEPQPKGLRCLIYRSVHGDCSNGGISGRVDQVTLVGPGIPMIFFADGASPAVMLRELAGAINAVPADGDSKWWTFGGCFIWTSDGKFPAHHPIPLHDRAETAEQARAFSY